MTAPLFYVAAIDAAAKEIVIEGSEAHHAVAVRRLSVGEVVAISDGRGAVAKGLVAATAPNRLTVQVQHISHMPPPQPRLVVVQALPKGDRADLAVSVLTEVGVDVIVPWSAQRCIVRWDAAKAERGVTKWRSTATEAGKQSRRPRLPVVSDLADTAAVVELLAQGALGVVLHESSAEPLAGIPVPEFGDVVVVVGPEGGLTDEEVTAFETVGALAVQLGPSVLRTSTAGVVAASVLLAATPRWS